MTRNERPDGHPRYGPWKIPESLSVLLVDDNPDDRALVARVLVRDFPAIQIHQVGDEAGFREALEMGEIDLVITDFQLHWSDGLEVLREVKARWQGCPVIMFTGTGTEELAVQAMKAGLDDYVLKTPKHYVRLPGAVIAALEGAYHLEAARRGEEERLSRTRQQSLVADLGLKFLAGMGLQELMDRATSSIAKALDVEYAKILELLSDGRAFLLRSGVGWKEGLVGTAHVPAGKDSQAGYTLVSNEAVLVENLADEQRFSGPELMTSHGVVSGMSVVVHGPGARPWGVFGVHTTRARRFGAHDTAILQAVANVVGSAIQRRASELETESSERKFRTLFESAADAIVLVNGRGEILDVNPAGETLADEPRAALLGRDGPSLLLPDNIEQARTYLEKAFREEPILHSLEVTLTRTDGSSRILEVRSRLVRPSGAEPFLELIARDVTEAREAVRQKLENERLASLGRVAAYIAHELNNPLTNISLLTSSVERKVADPVVWEKISRIHEQRLIAAKIISDLLSFAKPLELRRETADLREIVLKSVEQIGPRRKEDVDLIVEAGDHPFLVRVDPLRLMQVFVNLLQNAFEATERGQVRIRLEPRADHVAVSVEDTGTGMPPEVLRRVYEPFFTTKAGKKDMGLGLTFSRTIVSSHGGRIDIASEQGKGSTFRVVLPQATIIPLPPAR